MESSVSTTNTVQSILKARVYSSSTSLTRRYQWQLFILALIFSDIFFTALAFRAAYFIRFQLSLDVFHTEVVPSYTYYQSLVLIIMPLGITIFALMGLYQRSNLLVGTAEYSTVFNAATNSMIVVIAAGFLLPDFVFARGWLLLAWGLSFLFVASGRFAMRRVVFALRENGYFLSPALIIGTNAESLSLAEQLGQWRSSGLLVLGFIDKYTVSDALVYGQMRSLGTLDNLPEIIKKYHVNELIITTSALTRDEIMVLFKKYGLSDGISLRLSSGMYEILTTGMQVTEMASVPLVRVNQTRLTGVDRFLKFSLDYILTIPALILLAPLFVLIPLAIKLDSPGPAIYRRRVMGVNGNQFDAFKFRTMYMNGNEILEQYPEKLVELSQNHKLVDDPRITRIGKLLRKTSLDELPQLVNVMRREMSLVGPRMISPAEMAMYDKWDMNLLTVNPGITGLWQVSGRSDVSYDERVRLDMHYIRNWSIWLDIKLVLNTVPAVLKGRGAY